MMLAPCGTNRRRQTHGYDPGDGYSDTGDRPASSSDRCLASAHAGRVPVRDELLLALHPHHTDVVCRAAVPDPFAAAEWIRAETDDLDCDGSLRVHGAPGAGQR